MLVYSDRIISLICPNRRVRFGTIFGSNRHYDPVAGSGDRPIWRDLGLFVAYPIRMTGPTPRSRQHGSAMQGHDLQCQRCRLVRSLLLRLRRFSDGGLCCRSSRDSGYSSAQNDLRTRTI